MKKIITLILGLCLCFALIGCDDGSSFSSNYIPSSDGLPPSSPGAYYEDGNLYIPVDVSERYKVITIVSDKYVWYA